jgi:hypothetical protein
MQVGLNNVTSAICKSQLQFGQANNYQLLYITSTTYFQSAAVIGRRNTNFQPVQSPAGYLQPQKTKAIIIFDKCLTLD